MSSSWRGVVFGFVFVLGVRSNAMADGPKVGKVNGASAINVASTIKAECTISLLKPTDSLVKRGDLVVELENLKLKQTFINQEIATKSAEAAYQNARLTREVAEIAVPEYEEGIFKQDRATIDGEIALAKADQKRAADRAEWVKKMLENGKISGDRLISRENDALKKATLVLEQANQRMTVLENYTKSKTVKELRSEVEKSRADELAKEATWKSEVAKLVPLQAQRDQLRIVAPADGRVEYVRPLKAGEVYRQGDVLFRLVPVRKPNAETK